VRLLPGTRQGFTLDHDHRGTANTIPYTWIETEEEALDFWESTMTQPNSSAAYARQLWDRGTLDADLATERASERGRLISTPAVARDMIQVVDALGEDGMLSYWGFSYGTTLGATAASMFPERIDKMLLDGVQNPYEYYFEITQVILVFLSSQDPLIGRDSCYDEFTDHGSSDYQE
jgi:pimeloyl-ACP methyl ester carboxylesterase